MPNKSLTRAFVYTRISVDKDGESVSPQRQEALCRQAAEAKGWEVVAVLSDRDKSGWRKGVRRPGFEKLEEAVARGDADVVMAYSLSRLGRRASALMHLVDFLREHECELFLYNEGTDTSTAAGKVFFNLVASLAEMESDQISERVRSATGLAAASGKVHTGGMRHFGYERDGTINPVEAKILRDVAKRVLAGQSMRSLAIELNDRGVTTTTGGGWSGQTLRQTLRSPRLAGLRIHNTSAKRNAETVKSAPLYEGDWKPVLDRETWATLRSALDTGKRSNSAPAHLLTGLIICRECGYKMHAHTSRVSGKVFHRYQCIRRPPSKACGKVSASKESADSYVVGEWLDFMSNATLRPEADRVLVEVDAELVDAESRRSKLAADHYVRGTTPEDVFAEQMPKLTQLIEELRRARDSAARSAAAANGALPPGDRDALERWWESASLEDRRAALRSSIHHIYVMPAKRLGGNVFDTTRLEVFWSPEVYERVLDNGGDVPDAWDEFGNVFSISIGPHEDKFDSSSRTLAHTSGVVGSGA